MPAGLRVSGPVKRTGARRHQALAHWSLLQACCPMRRGPPQQVWPAVSRERSAAALRNLPESMLPRALRSVEATEATRSPPAVLTAHSAATQWRLTESKPEWPAALHCRARSIAALPVRSRERMAQSVAAQWRPTGPKPESPAALHCRALRSVAALPIRSRARMAQSAAAQWRLTEPKPRVSQLEQLHRGCSQLAS